MTRELTIHVEYENPGLSRHQVSIASLTDQPRLQVLSTNCGIRQVVRRHIHVFSVVIGFVYHHILEKPPDLWWWFPASNFTDQIYITSLIIGLLDSRDDFHRRTITNSWPLWCNWKKQDNLVKLMFIAVNLLSSQIKSTL